MPTLNKILNIQGPDNPVVGPVIPNPQIVSKVFFVTANITVNQIIINFPETSDFKIGARVKVNNVSVAPIVTQNSDEWIYGNAQSLPPLQNEIYLNKWEFFTFEAYINNVLTPNAHPHYNGLVEFLIEFTYRTHGSLTIHPADESIIQTPFHEPKEELTILTALMRLL